MFKYFELSKWSEIFICFCISWSSRFAKKTQIDPPPSDLTHVCVDTIDTLTYDNFFVSSLSSMINIWLKIAIVRDNSTIFRGVGGGVTWLSFFGEFSLKTILQRKWWKFFSKTFFKQFSASFSECLRDIIYHHALGDAQKNCQSLLI